MSSRILKAKLFTDTLTIIATRYRAIYRFKSSKKVPLDLKVHILFKLKDILTPTNVAQSFAKSIPTISNK